MILNPLIYFKQHTEYFKKIYSLCPEDHGWSHIVDVVWNARSVCMANNIPYTKEIELGAILHDIGNRVSRDDHNIISAKMVPQILNELNIDDVDVGLVQDCCRYHRASEKADITKMDIAVQVVSAADRMRPSTNKEDLFRDVYYRAYLYSCNHTEEVEDVNDPVYSSWKWVHDTYTTDNARSKHYSDLYRNTFETQLNIQKDIVASISLQEYRDWMKRNHGVDADINVN